MLFPIPVRGIIGSSCFHREPLKAVLKPHRTRSQNISASSLFFSVFSSGSLSLSSISPLSIHPRKTRYSAWRVLQTPPPTISRHYVRTRKSPASLLLAPTSVSFCPDPRSRPGIRGGAAKVRFWWDPRADASPPRGLKTSTGPSGASWPQPALDAPALPAPEANLSNLRESLWGRLFSVWAFGFEVDHLVVGLIW